MLALRMRKGLHLCEPEKHFELNFTELAGEALQQHIDSGLVTSQSDFVSLTTEGLLIADTVISDFL